VKDDTLKQSSVPDWLKESRLLQLRIE